MTVDSSSHGSATEIYLQKPDLDGRVISNFTVTDETGKVFEDTGEWDTDRSRREKDGTSGLIETNGGYELCWGFGEFGNHVYTLSYTMTEVVRSYEGADAIAQYLVSEDIFGGPQHVKITIYSPDVAFTQENTGLWAFGFSVNFGVQDGKAVFESDRAMKKTEYVSVLLEFQPGMFQPTKSVNRTFEDLKEEGMRGSSYNPNMDENSGGIVGFITGIIGLISRAIVPIMMFAFVMFGAVARNKGKTGGSEKMKPEYKNPEYSREIPFKGSLPMSYARLKALGKMGNDSGIIGSYMLRWIRNRQIELMPDGQVGKGGDSIRLYSPREGMEPQELGLYNMLLTASGGDYILQPKEFEKWSKKNYEKVESWLEQYNNTGMLQLRNGGFAEIQEQKAFFNLITQRVTVMNPLGEEATVKMFGFKRYLEEFTIINEREAREVQLWDEYLVFAQLFGIADKVAEQFKQIYPDYFRQVATQMGYSNMDMYDVILITHMANRYSSAMNTGYRAGYNAAHASTYSGGGGHYSGGGGGFSGGGGGGGGGAR